VLCRARLFSPPTSPGTFVPAKSSTLADSQMNLWFNFSNKSYPAGHVTVKLDTEISAFFCSNAAKFCVAVSPDVRLQLRGF
jgi:hypothetical protein